MRLAYWLFAASAIATGAAIFAASFTHQKEGSEIVSFSLRAVEPPTGI